MQITFVELNETFFYCRMSMLPGTNWTPYMLAVSQQNGALKENGKCRDNVAILDILTSIYADFNGDFDVLKFVTFSNTLDMTAMGKTYAELYN